MKVRHLGLISVLALAAPAVTLEARQQWGSRGLQQAYNEGYQRGVRAGDEDARRGQAFDYRDERDYRSADAGYRRQYGDVEWYRNDFRRGFQEGYRVGYDRSGYNRGRAVPLPPGRDPYGRYDDPYGRYDDRYNDRYSYNRYGRSDLAFSSGYNDGYDRGLDDGRDRRRNDPFAESRYRSADHGYQREYGPKEEYKYRYREAFRQGYEQGYRDGSRRSNRPWWFPF